MVNAFRSAGRRDSNTAHADLNRTPHRRPVALETPLESFVKASKRPSEILHKNKRRRLNNSRDNEDDAAVALLSGPSKDLLTDSINLETQQCNGKRARVIVDGRKHAVMHPSHKHDFQDSPPVHQSQQITPEKRVLRSSDGTLHSDSELAYFFPEYEEYIFGPKKPQPRLNVNSTLFVTERIAHPQSTNSGNPSTPQALKSSPHKPNTAIQDTAWGTSGDVSLIKPLKMKSFDIESLASRGKRYTSDPLTDDLYTDHHKKGERKEKSFRIKQHDWAIHEKAMLGRLSEELKGPDWLRTMGISGITETEKKAFEPKRDHFLRAVQGKINQFNNFKEKEKALQHSKEQMVKRRSILGLDGADDGNALESVHVQPPDPSSKEQSAHEDDVDASALQLQHEAQVDTGSSLQLHEDSMTSSPDRPFVSFFTKSYQRASSEEEQTRMGSIMAFGQPVPEPEYKVFALPSDVVSQEDFAVQARKRRRLNREVKEGLDAGG